MKDALKEFVSLLMEYDNFMSFKHASKLSGYTARYLSKMVQEENHNFVDWGFNIEIEPRVGYHLTIIDPIILENALNEESSFEFIAKQIVVDLCLNDDYFKIDSLSDKFHVSRSTMERIIRQSRDIATEYSLEIVHKPHYGIKIEGKELNRRHCLSSLSQGIEKEKTNILVVQEILYTVLKKHEYVISDMNFNNLVFHLLILLRRLNENVQFGEDLNLKFNYEKQRMIAKDLVIEIETVYDVKIPDFELNYLILHLLGKETLSENVEIREEVLELVDEIIEAIFFKRNVDLRDNFELKMNLALHIQPLLYRLKYNFSLENPILKEIKRDFTESYDLSLVAREVILEKYDLVLDDNEVSYLAMHFSLALVKEKENERDVKILLICASGFGTSRLLMYKLMQKYDLTESQITLGSLMQLEYEDISSFSFVVSTVHIPFKLNIPVIIISPLLDDISLENISRAIDYGEEEDILKSTTVISGLKFKNKEEVFRYITNYMVQEHGESEELYTELVKREKASSTEVGNRCSLPHPVSYEPKEAIAMVLILDKPIRWDKEKVKFVFFMALPNEYDRSLVIDQFVNVISDKSALYKLAVEPNLETLRILMR